MRLLVVFMFVCALSSISSAQQSFSPGHDAAARACERTATSSTISSCLGAVSGAYFLNALAAEACGASATSSTITACIQAISNKDYLASAVRACRSTATSSTIASCLAQAGVAVNPPHVPSYADIRDRVDFALYYLDRGELWKTRETLENLKRALEF